jgi:hypothetical protein
VTVTGGAFDVELNNGECKVYYPTSADTDGAWDFDMPSADLVQLFA